jgi:hypothetical protein
VVSSASSAWLLSTPVSRGGLLRPQLWGGLALSALAGGIVPAGLGALCGWPAPPALLLGLTTGLLGAAGYASAVLDQARRSSSIRRLPAHRVAAVVLALALVTALLVIAAGRVDGATQLDPTTGLGLAAAALLVLAVTAVLAGRSLATIGRRVLDEGSGLASGLAGALAALDLALAYDVVVTRVARAPRGPSRLRGRGIAALAWADLARLRRSPGRLVVLLGTLPAAYALRRLDVGAFIAPLTMTCLLAAALGLLPGLRTLATSSALARMLGASDARLRIGTLVVPAGLLLLLGLATAPAMPGHGPLTGLAVGLGATAAAVRWVTGRPPDYGRPLVSTPAGGVPVNLYSSIARGLDVVVLVSIPLLFSPTVTGADISLGLSTTVLAWLILRP